MGTTDALCKPGGPVARLLPGSGFRTGIKWTGPGHAAAITSHLLASGGGAVAAGVGDVVCSPHHRQEWARRAVANPHVLNVVCSLLGPRVAVAEPTLLLVKRPGRFAVPPHQDGLNGGWHLDPDRAVSVWFAVTDATPANGCVQVVPGSHRGGYRRHVRGADEDGRGAPLTLADPPPDTAFQPVPLPAGHAVVMDVRLVHRSAPNTTRMARVGLNVCYVAPGGVIVYHGQPPRLLPVRGA
ncbi:hypothetical protein Arub01_59210 [Actinomadura rubrobrunea]|uniref:Phytanoyl-CoA dioxygenase family protein n=1 Tax=Actinomadura rubrobrunea TaxID=115335 RepID=A0A9W6Q362_9ACTN|nr:hypothetical protein Arub01_59210 [Actinomadura rubrobrunea]